MYARIFIYRLFPICCQLNGPNLVCLQRFIAYVSCCFSNSIFSAADAQRHLCCVIFLWLISKGNNKPLGSNGLFISPTLRPLRFCVFYRMQRTGLPNKAFPLRVLQVQRKVGRKDGQSFKEEQQRCDSRCYRHALCAHVCKCRP